MKAICKCGKKAIFVIRKENGEDVFSLNQVAIDGEKEVTYESVCASCYQDRKERLYQNDKEVNKCKILKY